MPKFFRRLFLLPLIGLLSPFIGCAGSNQNLAFPSLSTLQNPVRVPAPATGSFSVPGSYSGNPISSLPPMSGQRLATASDLQPNDGWHASGMADNTSGSLPTVTGSQPDTPVVQASFSSDRAVQSSASSSGGFSQVAPVGTGVRPSNESRLPTITSGVPDGFPSQTSPQLGDSPTQGFGPLSRPNPLQPSSGASFSASSSADSLARPTPTSALGTGVRANPFRADPPSFSATQNFPTQAELQNNANFGSPSAGAQENTGWSNGLDLQPMRTNDLSRPPVSAPTPTTGFNSQPTGGGFQSNSSSISRPLNSSPIGTSNSGSLGGAPRLFP